MGMRFTPRGNATDVCAGLVEFELSRPPLTQTLYDVNLGLFIAFVIIIMPLVVLMYVYRDHPRFAKVRPLYLSYLAFAFALIYTSGGYFGICVELALLVYYVCAMWGDLSYVLEYGAA
ncbi:hypothetical protein BASA81_012377 [Batrachochytrium salamandrivorans]|nr:hypothetical protein BASA81_012377 [Batrachochytrium salamandrivorans]